MRSAHGRSGGTDRATAAAAAVRQPWETSTAASLRGLRAQDVHRHRLAGVQPSCARRDGHAAALTRGLSGAAVSSASATLSVALPPARLTPFRLHQCKWRR